MSPHVKATGLSILTARWKMKKTTLAAHAEGLGSCILGWFNESKMRELLAIPDSKRVWLDIAIGYSVQPLRPKKRKALQEVVSYNGYKVHRK